MDIEKAYEIIGLPNNSSLQEVEKWFDIWVKRTKGIQNDETQAVILAYKTIKEFARQSEITEYNKSKFGTNIGRQRRNEKLEHFWLQYRGKLIAAIAILGILALVMNIVIKNIKLANLPAPALKIMMYGDFYGGDEEKLQSTILADFTDWERITAIINFLPSESDNPANSAYVQKSFVLLATEHPDIYIVDKATFKTLLAENMMLNLDSMKPELAAKHSDSELLSDKQEKDKDAHLYGVDLSNNPIWESIGLPLNDKIAVVSTNVKNLDNAKLFIMQY